MSVLENLDNNHRRYTRMLYSLGLLSGLAATGYGFNGIEFNFGVLNYVKIYFVLLIPFIAFFVFCFGPTSKLRSFGMVTTILLSLVSFVLFCGLEFNSGAIEYAWRITNNGGVTDKMLRTFTPEGTIIGEGRIGDKRIRLSGWSNFTTTRTQYEILATRDLGPYFHQIIQSVKLPTGSKPTLVHLKDGNYELREQDSSGHTYFRAKLTDVLNEKVSLPE